MVGADRLYKCWKDNLKDAPVRDGHKLPLIIKTRGWRSRFGIRGAPHREAKFTSAGRSVNPANPIIILLFGTQRGRVERVPGSARHVRGGIEHPLLDWLGYLTPTRQRCLHQGLRPYIVLYHLY